MVDWLSSLMFQYPFFPYLAHHNPHPLLIGGAFPFTIGRVEHGFNVRPDLCAAENNVNPRKYIGQIYTDSLVHDEKALKYLVETMGEVGHCFNFRINY